MTLSHCEPCDLCPVIAQPNVAALGGTWIAPADKLAAGDFAGIEALAREAYLASQMA